MTKKLLSEKWLKPEHLQAIGMVSVEWSYLEHVVSEAIWDYAYIDHIHGRCVTSHMSVPMRLDVLKSLFFEHFGDSEQYKKLSTLVEKVKNVAGERNKIAHASWFESENVLGNTVTMATIKARGKLVMKLTDVNAEQIRQIADSIEDVGNQLAYFADTNPPPPSSEQKP